MIIEKKEDTKMSIGLIPDEMKPMAEQAQELIELRSLYKSAIKEVSTKLEILDDEFQVKHDHNPIHHMENRVKSIQSIFEKLMRLGYNPDLEGFSKITDIAGIRVICKYLTDVYSIYNMLLRQDDIELIAEKDYIRNPKPNGYRSLHIVVLIPVFLSNCVKKVPVEIQIRTVVMDTWASLEHELRYKSSGELSSKSQDVLKKCAESMNDIDRMMEDIHSEAIENGNCETSSTDTISEFFENMKNK